MCKEVEMTPENALQRLSGPFWAAFAGELVSVFGIDIFQPEEDVQSARAIEYLTGTCGWHAALKAACREVGDEWFYEWYDSLGWMESDGFDYDLVDELVDRVIERGEETRHVYYEWLVKNSLSLSEKLLIETGLAT